MEQLVIDQTLERIRVALETGKMDEAITALTTLHPADQAEAFAELHAADQAEMLPRLDAEETADIFEHLEEDDAAQAASQLTSAKLADVLDEMDPDDAADVLGDLTPEQAATVIAQMDAEQAEDVVPLLAYEDDTAGGLMTPDFPYLEPQMTCQGAIERLRSLHPDAATPYYLYVLDRDEKLKGIVGLRDLIVAPPTAAIETIARTEIITVPAGTDQEEVARLFKRYGLLSLPVVDANGKLVGVISHDDVTDVIEAEVTEDMYRLANVSDGDLQIFSPVKLSIQRRLPWLAINLFTAFLAASVVGAFESTIAKVSVLAVFQSIVAGQGGNAGTQTLAMVVRGIAVGEVEFKDAWRAILREAGIGIIHGLIIGTLVAIGAYLWKGIPVLGLVIGLAMTGNMIAAGIAGTLVPLTLKLFKLDPALASAVMVTTVTDCVGFGLFLGLATVFIQYLI